MKKIGKHLKIYLADDDADDRHLFAEAIEEVLASCELKLFRDGRELLNYFQNEATAENLPDMLFLDINMPLINGLEVLQIIRNDLGIHALPIAMYSTSNLEINIEEALSSGANIYITKPTCFGKLKELVYRALLIKIQAGGSDLAMGTFVLAL